MTTGTQADSFALQLQRLEQQQQDELYILIARHRQARLALINQINSEAPEVPPSPINSVHHILSHSKRPLQKGDTVTLRTTTEIGNKGDIAVVTFVEPQRIEVFIPRINDSTWRQPHNVSHRK